MTLVGSAPLLGENSLFHSIGQIFHPIYVLFASILAAIYGVIPNYAVAIALLTILIMGALTPLTVKSTKSMIAMQRMQPEIKKLQQKYKGAENREQLNKEMMRLYKEQGINPAGGCIPMLLQMPFLFILYGLIRGLTNTLSVNGKQVLVHGHPVAQPNYIPHTSQMYHNLVAAHGEMVSFGVNLALKPIAHHPSFAAAIPFYALVVLAVVLQYVQMAQMNSRNPQAQANKQMQTMQRVMPVFFAYIYFIIPAAVVIYMVVSTLIRIATQDIMFRTGIVQPAGAERVIPANSKEVSTQEKTGSGPAELGGGGSKATGNGSASSAKPGSQNGQAGQRRPASPSSRTNGRGSGSGAQNKPNQAKQHPRSKTKRARKAR